MPRESDRRALGVQGSDMCRQRFGVVVALLLSTLLAGCSTNGQPSASPSAARAATIAFESIEGPPPGVSQRLVQTFDEQARTRQVVIVSREGLPHYRVRGQFAARTERGRTTIAWAWDVHDTQDRRVLHITGEEVVGPGGREPWSAVDDQALARIALGGVEPLVAFLASPSAIAAAEAAPRTPVAVNDDFTPEASGIFRIFRSVWPKSEDKKPPVDEVPAKTPEAPPARAAASERPTDYSALPARKP